MGGGAPNWDAAFMGGVTNSPPVAPATGSAPRGQLQSATIKGMRVVIPGVDTGPQLSRDQELDEKTEDMFHRLNDLESTVNAAQARHEKASPFDKYIGGAIMLRHMGNPMDPQAEEIGQMHRQYAISKVGVTPFDDTFNAADSARQAIQGWIIKNSGTRSMQAVKDVENHMPFATDTLEKKREKIAFWRGRMKEVSQELGRRGLSVYEPPAPSPMEPAPSMTGPAGRGLPTPPFRMDTPMKIRDGIPYVTLKNGVTWYVDPSSGEWRQVGK